MYDKCEKSSKLKVITNQLEQGVKEFCNTEKYKQFLTTMSRFHRYSARNSLLIALQRPDATLVAGYTTWKKIGRQVQKGESGITILAPIVQKEESESHDPMEPMDKKREVNIIRRYRPVTVFDIAQTQGKDLPDVKPRTLLDPVKNYQTIYAAIEKVSPVPITFENIESSANGYYHIREKRIVIRSGMPQLQTIKTAIHEVAHAQLHDPDFVQEKKGKHIREVEAESVAYVVCSYYNLDTSDYSFPYLAGWSTTVDYPELISSMEIIRKTSAEMIERLDPQLQLTLAPNELLKSDLEMRM